MEPGPANIGIAKGVSAISFLLCASSSAFLSIPLFFENFPFNNEKPELAIIIPPAILSAVIVIPKNDNTY